VPLGVNERSRETFGCRNGLGYGAKNPFGVGEATLLGGTEDIVKASDIGALTSGWISTRCTHA
jgi:hypothetical protein